MAKPNDGGSRFLASSSSLQISTRHLTFETCEFIRQGSLSERFCFHLNLVRAESRDKSCRMDRKVPCALRSMQL